MQPIQVVGQGIAGTMLSWFLLKHGFQIQVFDPGDGPNASLAAGALINPVTGKAWRSTWLAPEVFPHAEDTYRQLSEVLQFPFFQPLNMYKVLNSVKEQNDYQAAAEHGGYLTGSIAYFPWSATDYPFGFGEITGAARIAGAELLTRFRAYLKQQGLLVERCWQIEDGANAERIVFCDGYGASTPGHPFSYLPWQWAKGEYLLIQTPSLPKDKAFKAATTLVPMTESGVFYAGGTFQWHFDSLLPSAEKREELEAGVRAFAGNNYHVLHHGAAVRPAVRDRRPYVGSHPVDSRFWIFNGFGTKGYTLAPFFAAQLVRHWKFETPLSAAVAPSRFAALLA
ncbi:MAG: FAD-dependent oxidoreductase [Chitinophagales bacterium]